MSISQPKIKIKKAEFSDIRNALILGVWDFYKAPLFGMLFASIFVVGGLMLLSGVFAVGMLWLAYPLVIGFSLVGPFVATGFYEISRLVDDDKPLKLNEVIRVMALQHRRELGWMAFVMLFIFWIWMYQIRTLVVVFFGASGFADTSGFLEAVFTTPNGWTFIVVGHFVGAIISLVLFMLTVISCPLLLDRDVDFVTAMLTSIKAVLKSPIIMLGWGCFVVVTILVSATPFFLGLLFTLPILGHATWHLYRLLISVD